MKAYLEKKIGGKLGVIRAGMPKEVYFEAVLKEVTAEVAVFADENGREFALPLDKVLLIGPPEKEESDHRPRVGFFGEGNPGGRG